MKLTLLLVISQFVLSCFGQDTTVLHLDEKWRETNVEEAKYQRIVIHIAENNYKVEDYLRSGQPVFTGHFQSEKIKQPFGEFVNYDDNGTIREVYNFNQEGNLDQKYLVYTEKGIKDSERFYSNGKKDGLWKWYYENGSICWFEQWRDDTLVMLQQFREDGKEFVDLYNVRIAPKWKTGTPTVDVYLKEKLKLSSEISSLTGVFNLFITAEGKVHRIDSKSKLDKDLVESIEKILVDGPTWFPALDHLRPVYGVLEIEISF